MQVRGNKGEVLVYLTPAEVLGAVKHSAFANRVEEWGLESCVTGGRRAAGCGRSPVGAVTDGSAGQGALSRMASLAGPYASRGVTQDAGFELPAAAAAAAAQEEEGGSEDEEEGAAEEKYKVRCECHTCMHMHVCAIRTCIQHSGCNLS